MALRTPPSWLQNGSHPAENDRLSMQAIYATSGIIGTGSLLITQAAVPSMAVQSATGFGAIVGDFQTNMGVYQFYNDAATQLTVTTANPTNPRIDKVVVTINDAFYSGATNNVTYTVVAGTPAASPVAPATPTNSLSLATIAVGAAVTSILNANITDARVVITTNLPAPSSTVTLTGAQTLTFKTLTSPSESTNIVAAAPSATQAIDSDTSQDWLFTTNAANNFIINLRATSAIALNTRMAVSDTKTFVIRVTNAATTYYMTALQIDGGSITPKWQGTAPTVGDASADGVYTFAVTKTASATYKVLATYTKFA